MEKKQKILLFSVAFLLIVQCVFAVTLKAEKTNYSKGEEIVLTGICGEGENRIKAELGQIIVFDEQLNCFNGRFSFSYKSGFIDPSGNWEITLSNKEDFAKAVVRVNLTPESAYYRITFLSPAGFTFQRAEDVFISIELTDSGNPVENAEVALYDAFGRKIQLKPEGTGIYDINYSVPFDSPLGKWDLLAVASKNVDSSLFGSERRIETEIINANLTVNIIEPEQKTFELSDSVPFKAKIFYPNNTSLKNENAETVELQYNERNQKQKLEALSADEFAGNLKPEFSGSQEIIVFAKDKAGNTGELKVPLIISCSATCWLKNYGLIVLVFGLLLVVLTKLFYSKLKLSLELNYLKKERDKTWQLIKELQEEYFKKGIMPTSSYSSNLTQYRSKIIELDEKIKILSRKMEQEK